MGVTTKKIESSKSKLKQNDKTLPKKTSPVKKTVSEKKSKEPVKSSQVKQTSKTVNKPKINSSRKSTSQKVGGFGEKVVPEFTPLASIGNQLIDNKLFENQSQTSRRPSVYVNASGRTNSGNAGNTNGNGSIINNSHVFKPAPRSSAQQPIVQQPNTQKANYHSEEDNTFFNDTLNISFPPNYNPDLLLDAPLQIVKKDRGYLIHDILGRKDLWSSKISMVKEDKLLDFLKIYKLPTGMDHCRKHFSNNKENAELVVKISQIETWRSLMSAYTEAKIHEKIYNAEGTDENGKTIFGKDLVVKPYGCCPIFYGKRWVMVFVQGKVQGSPVRNCITNPVGSCYSTAEYLIDAVNKLWCLGFVHGDLHTLNAYFDPPIYINKYINKPGKLTFIDLEGANTIPQDVVDKYKQARREATNSIDIKVNNIQKRRDKCDAFCNLYITILEPEQDRLRNKINSYNVLFALGDYEDISAIGEVSYGSPSRIESEGY